MLTRGRKFDGMFKSRWKSPIDMDAREEKREQDAQTLIKELKLTRSTTKKYAIRAALVPLQSSAGHHKDSRTAAAAHTAPTGHGHGTMGHSTDLHPQGSSLSQSQSHSKSLSHSHSHLPLPSYKNPRTGWFSEPDRVRVVSQLTGHITYHMSNKDMANSILLEKHEEAMKAIKKIGTNQGKKGKRAKAATKTAAAQSMNSSMVSLSHQRGNPFSNPKYLQDLMDDGDNSEALLRAEKAKEKQKMGNYVRKPIKTKYDLELAEIDANDPVIYLFYIFVNP